MKTKRKFYIILLSIFVVSTIYFNSNLFIKNQNWKYNKGFHIGDFITNYKPENTFFCFGVILIVKNPEKLEFGYYHNKNFDQ
jgi:hypothetical protein